MGSRRVKTVSLLALLILSSAGGFVLLTGLGSKEDTLSADAEIASAAVRSPPKVPGDPAQANHGLPTVPRQLGLALDSPRLAKAQVSADFAVAAGNVVASPPTLPVEGERSEAAPKARNREWAWSDPNYSSWPTRWRYDGQEHPNLRGRDFGDAELRFVDLAYADLQHTNFDGADLEYADLRSANLKDAVLNATVLHGADLRDADLQGTAMVMVNLIGVDLRGANLRNARLGCPDCNRVSTVMTSNFKGADLRGAHFGNSRIYDSVFEEADLRGANLAATRGLPISLRGALYDDSTRWPERIDPRQWEMVYVADGGRSGPGADSQQ